MATSKTTRDVSDIGVEFLADSMYSSLCKLWEVQRTLPRLKLALATRTPASQALELLYSATFRSGLGNRLYFPDHKVGSNGISDLAPEELRSELQGNERIPSAAPRLLPSCWQITSRRKGILSKTTSQSPNVNSTKINSARVGKYFRTSEFYYDDFKTNSE